ncbi:MAG: NRDE family protein [Betaproteobacteria bacterium]|nr:NRDE family protein [Betaproteobacteria bacterium]
MCLILFAWRAHAQHQLIVAANRDEFYERPASAAQFWPDRPQVLAGRDLSAMGTWLGVTRGGRFAAITNFRNPAERKPTAPSRGQLVSDFLTSPSEPAAWLAAIAPRAHEYNGFSMLAGDGRTLCFYSNRNGEIAAVAPGIHGLSNHLLDTPWPKVTKGIAHMAHLLAESFDAGAYLELLADREPATDPRLPDTGVGPELERRLSSIHIAGDGYGTRCSTVLRIGSDGSVAFRERSYASDGTPAGTVSVEFALERR